MITLASFLLSCRNNEFLIEKETFNNSSKFQPTSKTIRLNQSHHKEALILELEKVHNNLHRINSSNKIGGDYSIDTDNITYIDNGPYYHTYTFNLIRENSAYNSPLENLVLTPLPDGTYKEILVSYNITEEEKSILARGGYVNTKGKTSITELSKETFTPVSKGAGMTTCGFVETYTIRNCSADEHGAWNTKDWGDCKAERKPGLLMTMTYRCDFLGDTNNPGTGGGNGGGVDTGGGTYVPGGGSTPPCSGNGIATGPLNPTEDLGDGNCTGIPTSPTISLSTFFLAVKNLPTVLKNIINDPANLEFYEGLNKYYDLNYEDKETKKTLNWILQFKQNNPAITWSELWNNKYSSAPNSSIDDENNLAGNYDESNYENFDFMTQQSTWPTVNNVIPVSEFVGWGASGVRRNCMDYAKAQIAKKGYKVSNYYDADSKGNKQTFQIYTEQKGVNLDDLYKGVSYLKYALSNGIPVIVGIDDKVGHPGNLDSSTDHFVVIVGMGTDSKGRFFRFYDNASGDASQGAHSENKLYIKYPDKIFTGKTQCIGYRSDTEYDYIMTMIRKSK
ncbi:hypothetical protein [Chryseobacterium nematophagum]|uniref:hypothetical protein n=1 Tax=Chryseobacterium nematophagum TaxID=2305228 RepID=UPI001605463A|nr:hypothetical protein [Chryseobacterium nematophagum]